MPRFTDLTFGDSRTLCNRINVNITVSFVHFYSTLGLTEVRFLFYMWLMISFFLQNTPILGPVDGDFGPWSVFAPCTKSCGGGIREFTRTCTNPEPSVLGKPCEGPEKKTEACNLMECPGKAGQNVSSESHNIHNKICAIPLYR